MTTTGWTGPAVDARVAARLGEFEPIHRMMYGNAVMYCVQAAAVVVLPNVGGVEQTETGTSHCTHPWPPLYGLLLELIHYSDATHTKRGVNHSIRIGPVHFQPFCVWPLVSGPLSCAMESWRLRHPSFSQLQHKQPLPIPSHHLF